MLKIRQSYFLIHSQSRMHSALTKLLQTWKSKPVILFDSECFTRYPDLYRIVRDPFSPIHYRLPMYYTHYIPNLGSDHHYKNFCNNKLSNNYYNWCRQEDYISDQIHMYKTSVQNNPITVRLPFAFLYPDAVPLRLNKRGHKNIITIQLLESTHSIEPDYFLSCSS